MRYLSFWFLFKVALVIVGTCVGFVRLGQRDFKNWRRKIKQRADRK
jgi:hypothetical protein